MSTAVRTDRTALVVAFTLVAVGLALLADQFLDIANRDLRDTLIFAGLAAVFLIAVLVTRSYGFLIATTAFAGLAAAKYAVFSGEDSGGSVLLGPGLGLIVAYVIGAVALDRTNPWPLIAGGVMALLGGLLVFGGEAGAGLAGQVWPLVLVALGLIVLAIAATRRTTPTVP
jgi:hypothetical protein